MSSVMLSKGVFLGLVATVKKKNSRSNCLLHFFLLVFLSPKQKGENKIPVLISLALAPNLAGTASEGATAQIPG